MTDVEGGPGGSGGSGVVAEPGQARQAGRAGRTGDDVRSDLHVAIEPLAEGLDIQLTSKVEALYGDAIRETVRSTLAALGVTAARVTVDDRGAVPWVIAARVEAAVRAAGLAATDAAAPTGCATRPPGSGTPRDRLRRSRLYLPGNEPKFMLNAGLHVPDAVILDLEDSVHPSAKAAARLLVRNALRCVDFGAAERMVRINQLPLGLEDLDAIVPAHPDLVLIPKVEHPDQVRAVAARIREARPGETRPGDSGARDPATRPLWLMPILESAAGVERAFDIATADESVVALTIGLEDYTADLGVTKTRDGAESLWARQRLVNAARAADVQAIDSVYGDVQDEEGLLRWALAARSMGFTGMGCVHPRQVRVIHRGFAPASDELDRAQRIVAAFEEAERKGLGVVSLGSKMIDAPVVLRARRLVERASAMGIAAGGGEGGRSGADVPNGRNGGAA